ncbi:MAG: T9SS type A sorting domain-containing protein [Bacteroidales bacterium]|nr:T9SS type A sorting domain-containing protein [Bacteroidales bacterium]
MYPNPANTTVRIEANSTMQQVAIYDVLGNLVSSINVNGKSANISLGSLSNGVYFVNIIQAEGNSTQRLVVTH